MSLLQNYEYFIAWYTKAMYMNIQFTVTRIYVDIAENLRDNHGITSSIFDAGHQWSENWTAQIFSFQWEKWNSKPTLFFSWVLIILLIGLMEQEINT